MMATIVRRLALAASVSLATISALPPPPTTVCTLLPGGGFQCTAR
jgi:hypothetical protein